MQSTRWAHFVPRRTVVSDGVSFRELSSHAFHVFPESMEWCRKLSFREDVVSFRELPSHAFHVFHESMEWCRKLSSRENGLVCSVRPPALHNISILSGIWNRDEGLESRGRRKSTHTCILYTYTILVRWHARETGPSFQVVYILSVVCIDRERGRSGGR